MKSSTYSITNSSENKDLVGDRHESKEHYLEMHGDFRSEFDPPDVYPTPERDDLFVIDFAKSGLKSYAAEKFIATLNHSTIGYAAPRVGHAPEALAQLAELYGKRAVFFAAASSQVTKHQAVVMAYKGCELRFVRIPAMPTLNHWIRQWAERNESTIALPFGLSNTPMVTAGLVALADQHAMMHGEPPEFWCAVSTGMMIRGLQIGWPDSKPVGIAVARNIKDGEIGDAKVSSYHKRFYQRSDYMPDFPTTATYDAKAYK